MRTRCMVVIGHVDHGKTALVRALTGIETDHTAQEQARGMSILPGFAHHSYPEGTLDLVDAPGHEDFIAAMVRGACGAQAALLVVSLVEGVRTQTLEHLEIAQLLGIAGGVVAVTKSDLVPAQDRARALEAISTALARSGLAQAPVFLCSAHTGQGLAALHAGLRAQLRLPLPEGGPLHSLLPVDRVFTRKGHGTVVTGTLLGADLAEGAQVILQPSGLRTTIRSLQSRGHDRTCIHAGERAAVNLRGVALAGIARGAVLTVPDGGATSDCFDVQLHAAADLKHMEKLRVLFGTTAAVATVRLLRDGFAQLRFAAPVYGYAGQRAVLRRLSPARTLGGAVVVDPQARPARAGDMGRSRVLAAAVAGDCAAIAHALCDAQGGVATLGDIARLSRRAGVNARAALGVDFVDAADGHVASVAALEIHKTRLLETLGQFHQAHPLRSHAPHDALTRRGIAPPIARHALNALIQSGLIRRHETGFALAAHDPVAALSTAQRTRMQTLEAGYRSAALTPQRADAAPGGAEDASLVALLVGAGRLCVLPNIALGQQVTVHASALTDAAATLRSTYPPPTAFTTSQARSALNTSRKIIVPVLEHFDLHGTTTRTTTRTNDLRRITGAYPVSLPATAR